MDKEFRFHLDTRTAELRKQGLSQQEAEARARQEFGALDLAKEECRDQLPLEWLADFLRDVRYALRSLRRTPAFAVAAVLTLALGIGANTAVFSLVQAILLRPLPYPDAARLLRIGERETQTDVSVPEYQFWKEQARSFKSVAAFQGRENASVVVGGKEARVPSMAVSTSFFSTTGIRMQSGREFSAAETAPAGPPVAIISDRLRQLGLHDSVTIGSQTYAVIGVLPANFWFPQPADLFLPLRPSGSVGDQGTNTGMLARLKPGVNLQQANAEMSVLSQSFRRLHVSAFDSKDWHGLTAAPFQTWLTGDVRPKLLLLFGAVGLLLSIAILNIASLILARLATMRKEIAIRRALGCSSARLLRQFALENLLISGGGGAAGLAGACLLLQFLLKEISFELHSAQGIHLNLPVILFTFLVSCVTGLIFTIAPLFVSMKGDIFKTLRGAGQSASGLRSHSRSALVIAQVALSVTLLVAAALLIHSLYRLNSEALGFDPSGVMTFSTPDVPARKQSPAANLLFANLLFKDVLLKKIAALPGVSSVATVNVLPFTGQNNFPTQRASHPDQSIGGMEIRFISPGYFDALRIPILRGRAFGDNDRDGARPVILVNEVVARKWWGQSSPLGDHVVVGQSQGHNYGQDSAREVVGVVADTKSVYLKAPPRPTVYLPIQQAKWATSDVSWVVRSSNLNELPRQLRQAVSDLDPQQPVDDLRTMDEIVSATKADSRFDAWLFGAFAALALLLSAVGLYGLLAFSVARRTSEIGTRVALGARPADVARMVLGEGLRLVVIGLTLGLAISVFTARLLSGLLFGVRATDFSTYGLVALLLLLVGLLASYLPAARAAAVSPITALRSE